MAGLREHRSHRLVEIDDCLIADAGFTPALHERFDAGVTGFDLVRPSVGDDIIGIELPQPKGETTPTVREVVESAHGSAEFDVSARGFWQVHPGAAATFLDAVIDETDPQPGESALDLYCGVGLFTRALADTLAEYDAWATGLRRAETHNRVIAPVVGGAPRRAASAR